MSAQAALALRQAAGGRPNSRLKARLNEASVSSFGKAAGSGCARAFEQRTESAFDQQPDTLAVQVVGVEVCVGLVD